MGLEKLKSAFSNITSFNKTDGESEFKDTDSQYKTTFGDNNTYNNAESWVDNNINLENSSWYFTDNQKRSKPQGSHIYTSHKLGEGDLRFQTLYTAGGTSTDKKYGPKLTIHDSKTGKRLSNPFIAGLFGQDGSEPYITHPVDFTDNDKTYPGLSQINPFNRNAFDSLARTTMFLGSTAGILHIVKQNLMGSFQRYRPFYTGFGSIAASVLPAEGLITPLLTPGRDFPFDSAGGLSDGRGATYSKYLEWRNKPEQEETPDSILNKQNQPFGVKALNKLAAVVGLADKFIKSDEKVKEKPKLNASNNVNKSLSGETAIKPFITIGPLEIGSKATKLEGDFMTTTPIGDEKPKNIEKSEHGMPFYFKDLRDNSYIIFRAYIDGLNETISPSWSPETYIGRSEPVYIYTNAEREIQFNLKLFANTKDELDMIYIKMNRLTSMCYPEYKKLTSMVEKKTDEGIVLEEQIINNKVRMKPPLAKFRLGELYGNNSSQMTVFIKSLSYNFPDESPWEIDNGRRVPKYVTVTMGLQVLHSEVPSLRFTQKDSGVKFYGINQTVGVQ